MGELSSMLAGALLKSSALRAATVVGIVALLVLRVVFAFRSKGAARKTRLADRAWS